MVAKRPTTKRLRKEAASRKDVVSSRDEVEVGPLPFQNLKG